MRGKGLAQPQILNPKSETWNLLDSGVLQPVQLSVCMAEAVHINNTFTVCCSGKSEASCCMPWQRVTSFSHPRALSLVR